MSAGCQRCSTPSDEATCGHCERRHHVKYAQGDGDRDLKWNCASCNAPRPANFQIYPDKTNSLLTVMSALSEKFEVVNKIQLPKLNGELAHIKHMSERIAKQNTEILRKLNDAEKRGKNVVDSPGFRKRNVQLPTLVTWAHKRIKACTSFESYDHQPMMPERAVRYRGRRKAHTSPLDLMVQAFNRRLSRSRTYTYRSTRVRRR